MPGWSPGIEPIDSTTYTAIRVDWRWPNVTNIIQYKGKIKTSMLKLKKRHIRKSYPLKGWTFLDIPEADVIYGIDEIDNIIQTHTIIEVNNRFIFNSFENLGITREYFKPVINYRFTLSKVVLNITPTYYIRIHGVIEFLDNTFLSDLIRYFNGIPMICYYNGWSDYVWNNYETKDFNINEIYKRILSKPKSLSSSNPRSFTQHGYNWQWYNAFQTGGYGVENSASS